MFVWLKLFREQLLKANMKFCYLDGVLFKSTQAEDEIDRFQNTDVSIPDLSKKVGGSGINLTSATPK